MKNIKIQFNFITLLFLLTAFFIGYLKNALIILFIIIMHELGHIIIIKIFKYNISKIEIFPFGGITKIDKPLNTRIYIDLLISLGGIIIQLFMMIFIKCPLIRKYNISIMLFNLLPIIPLDGSKILLEIYHLFFSFKKAYKLYIVSSLISIIIYIIINYHYRLDNYLIVSLFIIKTINYYKMRKIYHNKFIIERLLYDLDYFYIDNKNIMPNDYQKDHKYYYHDKSGIISEKDYLKRYYRIDNN